MIVDIIEALNGGGANSMLILTKGRVARPCHLLSIMLYVRFM